ncbi:hypothetical protein BJ741DRAFT_673023 [Chytriomyces cf. hyalinus JEL632]|nr:hypothetical protein BJ741DRAFT_585213 [Chytriomyces cf. hyalinus JEL632]KAI8820038.1 hypothetical protein BJ741DRAFT_585052 [Chytriomyces cf. hyalinus JEL632]KAI8820044.1 hypothetical protein BJ741DRAFT_673023 [Chytriomyces cf. hyalinus JEL632]
MNEERRLAYEQQMALGALLNPDITGFNAREILSIERGLTGISPHGYSENHPFASGRLAAIFSGPVGLLVRNVVVDGANAGYRLDRQGDYNDPNGETRKRFAIQANGLSGKTTVAQVSVPADRAVSPILIRQGLINSLRQNRVVDLLA